MMAACLFTCDDSGATAVAIAAVVNRLSGELDTQFTSINRSLNKTEFGKD
jgi:Flp pilus assembly pilin Flp